MARVHEELHDALSGFLPLGLPQQGIETQAVTFAFRRWLALGCADFASHDGWCRLPYCALFRLVRRTILSLPELNPPNSLSTPYEYSSGWESQTPAFTPCATRRQAGW